MTRKKALVILGFLIIGGAVVGANFYFKRQTGISVNAEALRNRDLESIVSASGKVQPKTQVNISANTTGRVTRLAVDEGERVKAGQFLLEIDPRSLEGQLQRGEASVAAAQSAMQQGRTQVEQALTNVVQSQAQLELAKQTLKRQQDLWKDGLTTKQDLERAENDVKIRESDLKAREADATSRSTGATSLSVGTTVNEGIVSVRIYAGGTKSQVAAATQEVRAKVYDRLSSVIFSENEEPLEAAVAALLVAATECVCAGSCPMVSLAVSVPPVEPSSSWTIRLKGTFLASLSLSQLK